MIAKKDTSKTVKVNAPSPGDIRETEQRREKFYAAAEPLFMRYGFRKTTVEEICAAASASKRTFYELFADKSELFARLAWHIAETMADRYTHRADSAKTAAKKLDILLDEYVRLCRDQPIFRIFFEHPELMKAFGRLATEVTGSPLMSIFTQLIREGMRTGEFRKVSPEIIPWIVYTLLDSMYLLVPTWTGMPGPLDDKKLQRELHAFIFHGLGCDYATR
jgi:AcrR family transcriptional regulator